MTEPRDARQFKDGEDVVATYATLSWNDGDAIFVVGHLPEKGTLLAYFGHQPQPGAGSHLRTKKAMKAISPRTFHQIGRVAPTPQPTNSSC